MTEHTDELDDHRGIAARKAVEIRRALAEAENATQAAREQAMAFERHIMFAPSVSWPEAAAKARYLLNLYAASLSPDDTRHKELVSTVLEEFVRLSSDE